MINLLPKEWSPYPGDYEKYQYDIRLNDGKEYFNCWPNAGKFWALRDNIQLQGEQVKEFRISAKYWFAPGEEEDQEIY